MIRLIGFVFFVMVLAGCNDSGTAKKPPINPSKLIHSYAIPDESIITHLSLNLEVDMDSHLLVGTANYLVKSAADAQRIVFDTRNLKILSVMVDSVETTRWWMGPDRPHLGAPLEVEIEPTTKLVSIRYETTDGAEALQWLDPQQTAGKEHPFMFTQSQAILARTWLPVQDSPGIRFTYDAKVKVPSNLMALMSAENPTERDSSGTYHFTMNQPIPAYLMALAVGDIAFKSLGNRTGVYAEPVLLEASAYEFADMQKMLESAEKLYGKYAWGRYDVLVLPPSFPFGGMENPRLTFATPTILAGDRSLTSLVAHELAHSWSGNLVTNVTWNDFWLNEGFTVYFERRIMEDIYGKPYADMLAVIGRQDLNRTLEAFADTPDDTKLKLDLEGRNPDDGMSDIAYEKGYLFLRTLEENVGRGKFDTFLKNYFSANAFKSMDTERFLESLKSQLLEDSDELYATLKVKNWVYEPGIPSNCIEISSTEFSRVETELDSFLLTSNAENLDTLNWTTHHWLHFIRKLPESSTVAQLSALDHAFGFSTSGNSEIAAEWYVLAINQGYSAVFPAMEAFLIRVGRRKFLMPIYEALSTNDSTLAIAKEIYGKARPNYHSVSANSLDELLIPSH